MANSAIDKGAKILARRQAWKRGYVQDSREEDQVSRILSARNLHVPTPYYRELSHGHFSYDNQKKLTGAKTIIPVYEAKMTGDTRLVVSRRRGISSLGMLTSRQYRIDCIPDGEVSYLPTFMVSLP